ncbi:ribosome maturation protein [Radiomyces spectabilis]|uniref:ribosome maturation protein n=1 Tax=Radiomyces spectabilis TaxID=64574 RepID=UPI00221E77F4|nr:ribosome maturation protein [Radiomyces spectabilis]KAI8384555.1 ribosome maturation protein [Radiomyces spectabilis]
MSGTATKNPCKLVYKSEDGSEYFVIANAGMAAQWKKDKTIPLIDVVQSFDVLTVTNGGNSGEASRPPSGILSSVFGTDNVDEVVKKIVEQGEEKGM